VRNGEEAVDGRWAMTTPLFAGTIGVDWNFLYAEITDLISVLPILDERRRGG